MKLVPRRLVVGTLVSTGALLAGVLVVPALAATEGVQITPSGAVNSDAAAVLTINTKDADQRFGAEATFTRSGQPSTFTVTIDPDVPPAFSPSKDNTGQVTFNFTDGGQGLGVDGPIDAGVYAVSVTGEDPFMTSPAGFGGGTDTCASCFTVAPAGNITVDSLAPSSLRPGTSADVSVRGNNFERQTKVEVLTADGSAVDTSITTNAAPLGTDTTPDTQGITTRTELKRRFTVGATSQPGTRNVRVTSLPFPGDPTGSVRTAICTGCFTVAGPPITSISPTLGFNTPGTVVTVTLNGTNITDGAASLEFLGSPGGATRSSLTIPQASRVSYTSTQLVATFDLSNAAPGLYQPVVRNATTGTVNACDSCRFTVQQNRTPTLTGLDRTGSETGKTQTQGSTATFDLTGTSFSKGAAVTVSGTGVTTTSVEFVSPTVLKATFQTTPAATLGDRNVTVTLADGKTASCTACYTVTAATSPTPSATATSTVQGRYVGLGSPVRVLDTRKTPGSRQRGEIVVDLSSQLPGSNVVSAVLNVTVTNPTARGFITAYPTGTTRPGTSNVNFELNQTQANEVTVRVPASKRVSLYVDSASAHVIADLVGSFTTDQSAGGRIVTQAPKRVFDSRQTSTPRRTGEIVVDLPDVATGTVDVVLNVTVTGSTTADPKRGRGFVVVYATGTPRPGTSNVNFDAGQQQANEVITRVGTGSNAKKVSVYVDSTVVGVIVDLVGYVIPSNAAGTQVFTPLTSPQRVLDSRNGTGTSQGQKRGEVVLTLPSSVIPAGATGVVLNVTATNGTDRGFVTVYPTGTANPGTSNVNFPKPTPATRTTPSKAGLQANEVISAVNGSRQVTLFVGGNGGPAVSLIADVVGYLTTSGASTASPSPTGAANCVPGTPLCAP